VICPGLILIGDWSGNLSKGASAKKCANELKDHDVESVPLRSVISRNGHPLLLLRS
jgi:hypothetical protein